MATQPWTAEEEELMEAAITKTKAGDPINWFSVAEAVGGGRTAQEVETHFEIMIKYFPPFIPTPQISRVSGPSQDSGSDARKGSVTHGDDGNGNGNGGGDGNDKGKASGSNSVRNRNGNGGKIGDYGSDHASTSKLHTGNTTESSSDNNVLSDDESDNDATFRSRLR